MILVASHPGDDHARGVIAELIRRRCATQLLDSAQFPARASLTQRFSASAISGRFVTGTGSIRLDDARVVWWRRPQPYSLHDDLDPEVTPFVASECHEAFAGALASLRATWVNPPQLDERAHHKPLQLATALRVGLPVPATLITNDPDEARDFAREQGERPTIYKTFIATEKHWRETRILRESELELLDSLRLAPVIFQEYVAAEADIRVTIVGDEMFAAEIHADPNGYAVDYRTDLGAATFAPTVVPDDTAKCLRELMRELGLVYGAADFRRTHDGRFVFLEVNPAGEWRFVEERTGQPITAAMASLLARLDRDPESLRD